ncbi:Gfo/Idh/MocA family protein [Schumannella soli]|uniref:Gfo/Idh/MocA family oxidoreductase n=1 Tax=Schumannella soli TaxID=2590779 RepID=A0A506XN13_9MICO|nr:Gfo/Idh/MocA family oxidoreductase [Schumannella soli]TPW74034.1 Gfo/Idh/MocA family oxidoreductase [Schumannella soli]
MSETSTSGTTPSADSDTNVASTAHIRAAVIGCGDISAVHLAAIAARPGTRLVAIADTDAGRREAASATHAVPGFATLTELLDAVEVDVVHVTTPHSEHAPLAIEALRRGVNVLLEKPFAHSLEAGRELADAVAAPGAGKLALCFQNRYNTPVRALFDRLRSGELGAIRGAVGTVLWHRTADYYRDRPWRGTWAGGGGGLLMNQAIHTLDLLQWMLGPVEQVSGSASTRSLGDVIEVEDTAEMVLTHAGGAQSVFFATLANSRNAAIEIQLETEHAVATLRGDLTIEWADGRVETVAEPVTATGERSYWGVSHELLIDHFHSTLADPEPFWIGVDAGLDTLTTINAVYDASFPDRAALAAVKETAE